MTYVVTAADTITNSVYQVVAAGGYGAVGQAAAATRIVDAQVALDALTGATLRRSAPPDMAVEMILPAGVVAGATTLVFEEVRTLPAPPPEGKQYSGSAFRLEAYQDNSLQNDFQLGELVQITLTHPAGDVHGTTQLMYRWDGTSWRNDGIACLADSTLQGLQCTLKNPPMGYYATFFETSVAPPSPTWQLYMPHVQR